MSDNGKELDHTFDWVNIHLTIAYRADLHHIDSNVVYQNKIEQRMVDRKKKAIAALEENVARLRAYFLTKERDPNEIIEGKRMWRQYKTWIEMLERQVKHIEQWLDINPPF